MTEQTWIALIVALGIVVLTALILGRRILIKWGKGTLETGQKAQPTRSMSMSASGPGATVRDASQISSAGGANQEMKADRGGVIERVQQDDRKPG